MTRNSSATKRLAAYFDRIGYRGAPDADHATLTELHRLHSTAIPFENIDVQLGRIPSRAPEDIHAKLVGQRRGGWCYEMNGLFGWALEQIGFAVTSLAGAVMRQVGGETSHASHLALLVEADGQSWLADVGFGGSLVAPLPLEPATRNDAPFTITLNRLDDGWWRFAETLGDHPFSFDFEAVIADDMALAARCHWLATDPASPFVANLVVLRRTADAHLTLRGRVLTTIGTDGSVAEHRLSSPNELVSILYEKFGLDVPKAATLWKNICKRHIALGLDAD